MPMSALKVGNIRACVSLSSLSIPLSLLCARKKGGRSGDPTFSFPFDGGGERSLLTLLYFWRGVAMGGKRGRGREKGRPVRKLTRGTVEVYSYLAHVS